MQSIKGYHVNGDACLILGTCGMEHVEVQVDGATVWRRAPKVLRRAHVPVKYGADFMSELGGWDLYRGRANNMVYAFPAEYE